MNFKYKHAILGGTFDRLHAGHKNFIEVAEKNSEKVTIGLVTDSFLGNRLHKSIIEPYEVRKKELIKFLESKNYNTKTTIYPLSDIYGPALMDPTIDMVLAIDESIENAKTINRERAKKGLPELEIVVVPMLNASDGGFISSKRIRNGEIDRNGNSYMSLFVKDLRLPEDLRPVLRKLFGEIIKTPNEYKKAVTNRFTIAIGDVVVANLVKAGHQANISILDFKTQRKSITDSAILSFLPQPDAKTKNAPSTINHESVTVLSSIIRKKSLGEEKKTIEVAGEEDLLAIPAILLSPLGAMVIYGMQDVGGIIVEVTEDKKNEVKAILDKFDILDL